MWPLLFFSRRLKHNDWCLGPWQMAVVDFLCLVHSGFHSHLPDVPITNVYVCVGGGGGECLKSRKVENGAVGCNIPWQVLAPCWKQNKSEKGCSPRQMNDDPVIWRGKRRRIWSTDLQGPAYCGHGSGTWALSLIPGCNTYLGCVSLERWLNLSETQFSYP